jgi:hypothetical protein
LFASCVDILLFVRRQLGAIEWERTPPETEHNWVNVSGLIHGLSYELRVVVIDPHIDTMTSDTVQFVTGVQLGNNVTFNKLDFISHSLVYKI